MDLTVEFDLLMESQGISHQTILSLGLTIEEYHNIIKYLGREPNFTELGVFSVMWSEHCSYKSSRIHLKKLPTKGPHVIQGPGENAGVVDIGDNQVVIFKMESHNHPSFIEPTQGAATGVGGILRDIFTMGAEPIALLDSLRFGFPSSPKTRYLVEGIISGISNYGNCFGCPTVGGEVYFHESYHLNPLVNVFCLGIADKDKIFYGRAEGKGNPVIYVGSKTGRDGIHGATMASKEFDDSAETKKPTVQVGDPFTEKLLLEACLELMKENCLIGIQDMGAAGLTSSSVEMASRAGNGILIDLSKVPTRESNMTPYELLLSESQERMLLVVKKGSEKRVKEIFDKWDLDMSVIGEVTSDGLFRVVFGGKEAVSIPVNALTEGAPVYERPFEEPKSSCELSGGAGEVSDVKTMEAQLKMLLASPNICSRKWIYRQYDYQVKANTVMLPGGDAAVVRIKNTSKAIAMTTDCNSRYCYIDPFWGAQWAVAEAARNLTCVGATPIGLTDCLNFGNPENPKIMWQFKKVVEGIAESCRYFEIPVVSGNVSFYNETNGRNIYPTPTIGMVGVMDVKNIMRNYFQNNSDIIVIIGENKKSYHDERLGGSEIEFLVYEKSEGLLPKLNLDLEKRVQETIRDLISQGVISSAHDCSEGGLSVAILESSFKKNIGAKIEYRKNIDPQVLLFGEAPSRVIVSLPKKNVSQLQSICEKNYVPFELIGETIRDRFIFNNFFDLSLRELKTLWENAFEQNFIH